MRGFAVIDVETTGFAPQRADRIVEVGLVLLDEHATEMSCFHSMFDPHRPLGQAVTHGIAPEDVAGAPSFSALAPWLLETICSRIIVAHNAQFDLSFLAAEFGRAGLGINQDIQVIDTLALAHRYPFGQRTNNLSDCCKALSIGFPSAHSTLKNARATASLLRHFLAEATSSEALLELAKRVNVSTAQSGAITCAVA